MNSTAHVLVCGGAGYIGSHVCKALARSGATPVTFDNLSTGHRSAVKWGPLVEGDMLHAERLRETLDTYRPRAVFHFAARSSVEESTRDPGTYFRNNVSGTLNLLDAMTAAGVTKLIFSSTASVYGVPVNLPIDERHPTSPVNPYGWSKLMAERCIEEYARSHGLRSACLRYFNAAGADSDGEIGEQHEPETHLVPRVLAAAESDSAVTLFGDDYETRDGTCIRDYVHVEDLTDAHLLAMQYLDAHEGHHVFNLGTQVGYTVSEVIECCERVSGAPVRRQVMGRRSGDPAILVASNEAARTHIGWRPSRTLTDCVGSAHRWMRRSP